jgi:Ca2+-binding EF-hand superfamily protein
MKNPAFGLRLSLLAICFSSAVVLAADPKGTPALSEFEGIDADRDGRISAREHAAAASKMFQAMDADRDGNITAAEMDSAYEKVSGKKASESDMSAADKIAVVDSNGDGVLTAAEHAAASRTMFGKMDADRDGYLNRNEWTAGHAALMRRAAK